MKRYRINVTEGQLRLIQNALEWFFRLQMGQFFDFCDTVAFRGYNREAAGPKEFDERIWRRDDAEEKFNAAFRELQNRNYDRSEDERNAVDLWHEIRHFLWKQEPEPKSHWVTAATMGPYIGTEPPAVIEEAPDFAEDGPKRGRGGSKRGPKGT